MRYIALSLLVGLLAGCGAQDPQTRKLLDEMARAQAEIKSVESSIARARTESEALDDELRVLTQSLADKLSRRIQGNDQVYLELDIEQVGGMVRAFLEGYEAAGQVGGVPYRLRLHGVHTRAHRERIAVSATASMEFGGAGCESSTTGYLLHLDRELMKLQDMEMSCTTPDGSVTLALSDNVGPMPLPISVQRTARLTAAEGVELPLTDVELITPLRASVTPTRLVMRASSISVRKVQP